MCSAALLFLQPWQAKLAGAGGGGGDGEEDKAGEGREGKENVWEVSFLGFSLHPVS